MQGLAISIRRAILVVAPVLSPFPLAAQQPDLLYRLEARVEETTGAVLGHGVVRYRHQGQDTLRWLTLAGPVNRIPPGTLAPAGAAPAGSLRITQRAVNGRPVTLQFLSPESDTSRVPLPPLATGDSATLEFS